MHLSSTTSACARRRAAGALAALTAALISSPFLTTPAQAAPLPATFSASATGDLLRLSSTVAGAGVAATDLVHSNAAVNSASGPAPATATSANVGASTGALGSAAVANTETAPPSHTASGTLLAATQPGVLSSGAITYTDTVNWAGALTCLPAGTPISQSVTRTAGATATLLGVQVVDTGAATTTATTSLEALAPTNDTRSVNATATADVTGLSLFNGLVTLSALQPSLTTVATSGPATSATLTASAITVTGPTGPQTLSPGGSVTVPVPLVGSVTLTMASNADVVDNGGGSFSTNLITADVTLLAGTGGVTLQLIPLAVNAVAPAGGVECALPVISITTPADGSATTDTTPVISGTSNVANGVVTLVIGAESHTVTTDANGNWSLVWPTPLANGAQTVTASVTKAGNTATDTSTFTITAAPPAIAISTPADGSQTTDTTPTFTGTSSVINGTITLTVDGGTPVTVATDAVGDWTYTPTTPLTQGGHTATATATTPGGTASDTTAFTVALPPTIDISTPADGSQTADTTPTFTGTSSVTNGTITLTIDGGTPVTVTTDAGGDWTYTPTTPLTEGGHTVTATATTAGGTASDTADFAVLAAGPLPEIAITTPADGSTTTDRTPDITGTSDVLYGTIVVVINDDTDNAHQVPTDADGNWALTPDADLPCGQNTVVAIAENQFGATAAQSVFTISCRAAAPAPRDPSTPASLARTGADVRTTIAVGLLLLLAGAGLIRRWQLMRL